MILVVGLGNPGEKFANTRHNAGFLVLDKLKQEFSNFQFPISNELLNYQFSNKFNSEILKTEKVFLAKPQTFMNDSGTAASSLSSYYKILPTDIYVVHDDLDIKLGDYKIQLGVGPKVHNGVNSIEEKLGTKDFYRVRVGIENRHSEVGEATSRGPVRYDNSHYLTGKGYVLQNFSEEEKNLLDTVTHKIVSDLIKLLKINE